ncbi:hypothetical protein CAEBREN_14996 [Caenorhabditis brenneri]|uniref:Uncharacterized protein n=1 Tax=Caenorhabditis brenneri TaxID=135651 RepID=G0NMW8_CAEBE|nr:hypothetical protein CAEBREN_14996 [Caenorhabditis brenneri]
MSVKVDLDELYPPKPRFLVFRHKECSAFWLGIGPDSREVRPCAGCQKVRVQATASFATIDDAYEYRNNLMRVDRESKLQAGNVRLITDKIDQQKRANLDPNHVRLPEVDSRESAGRNGEMFRRWLFWDPEFPATQMPAHQNYISNSRVWHYQPNPNEWTIGDQTKKEEQRNDTEKK